MQGYCFLFLHRKGLKNRRCRNNARHKETAATCVKRCAAADSHWGGCRWLSVQARHSGTESVKQRLFVCISYSAVFVTVVVIALVKAGSVCWAFLSPIAGSAILLEHVTCAVSCFRWQTEAEMRHQEDQTQVCSSSRAKAFSPRRPARYLQQGDEHKTRLLNTRVNVGRFSVLTLENELSP